MRPARPGARQAPVAASVRIGELVVALGSPNAEKNDAGADEEATRNTSGAARAAGTHSPLDSFAADMFASAASFFESSSPNDVVQSESGGGTRPALRALDVDAFASLSLDGVAGADALRVVARDLATAEVPAAELSSVSTSSAWDATRESVAVRTRSGAEAETSGGARLAFARAPGVAAAFDVSLAGAFARVADEPPSDPAASLSSSRGGPGPGPGPCLLYTSPSPRDQRGSRMPSSA